MPQLTGTDNHARKVNTPYHALPVPNPLLRWATGRLHEMQSLQAAARCSSAEMTRHASGCRVRGGTGDVNSPHNAAFSQMPRGLTG